MGLSGPLPARVPAEVKEQVLKTVGRARRVVFAILDMVSRKWIDIADPAVLAAELERVRTHYNTVRLHDGIGYVTPNDEHEGRGETVRQARRDGLAAADQARRAHRRARPDDKLPS